MAKAIIQLSNVNHFKGKAKFIICPFYFMQEKPFEISKKKNSLEWDGSLHYRVAKLSPLHSRDSIKIF